jgi:hypothetical protein
MEVIMKVDRFYTLILTYAALVFLMGIGTVAAEEDGKIVHDAEYHILEAQNGEKWAAEDKALDQKLAELRKKNGQSPNIVYILWDDTAYGAAGFAGLQKNFGYETPNMNKMAAKGINFRYLLGKGIVYTNAHYQHANTETIVGPYDPGNRHVPFPARHRGYARVYVRAGLQNRSSRSGRNPGDSQQGRAEVRCR